MTEKRDLIFEAAVRLFARDGFWKTSTASIAKEAGVANGTLFNCFASKEILIDEIYRGLKSEMYAFLTEGLPAKPAFKQLMQHSWKQIVTWALDHPVRWQLMEQLRMSELVSADMQAAVAEDFQFYHQQMEAAVIGGELMDFPVAFHMEVMIGQVTAQIRFLSQSEDPELDREAFIKKAFDCYWRGFARD